MLGEENDMEFRFSGSPDPGTHVFHAIWKPGFCLQRSQSAGDGREITYALVSL